MDKHRTHDVADAKPDIALQRSAHAQADHVVRRKDDVQAVRPRGAAKVRFKAVDELPPTPGMARHYADTCTLQPTSRRGLFGSDARVAGCQSAAQADVETLEAVGVLWRSLCA
jgi:hypothetical protein